MVMDETSCIMKEAMGAFRFKTVSLAPGQQAEYTPMEHGSDISVIPDIVSAAAVDGNSRIRSQLLGLV